MLETVIDEECLKNYEVASASVSNAESGSQTMTHQVDQIEYIAPSQMITSFAFADPHAESLQQTMTPYNLEELELSTKDLPAQVAVFVPIFCLVEEKVALTHSKDAPYAHFLEKPPI